jgi:hypothetical protein
MLRSMAKLDFQTADEGQERVRASFGKNFDRLVRRFDPETSSARTATSPPTDSRVSGMWSLRFKTV